MGHVGTDLTDQNSHSKMANVAPAQLQKSAGQLALMVMRITSSKAGMMNVDECWTLTTKCMRFNQIYYGRTQSLSNRRICEILQPLWSDSGILPASIINLPLSHLLLTAKLHTASATIFLAFRFHSMILSRSSEKSYGQTHSLYV